MHFPGQLALSLARPFPSSPSYARFNYQLFRVSQEFALAPPPPPRRHCFLSCVFFPLFLSRSSHGPHPPSLWTSVDKVRACVQIYAKEYSRAKENSSPLYLPFPIARTAPSRFRFRFLVERGAFFRPLPTTILQLFHAIIGVDRYTPALCFPLVFPRNRDPWLGAYTREADIREGSAAGVVVGTIKSFSGLTIRSLEYGSQR